MQTSIAGVNWQAPPVLLLAPPPVGVLTGLAEMFEGAEHKSEKFGEHYGRVAQTYGCAFLDTSPIITASPLDGIHWEAGEHRKLGQAVAAKVREII